MNGPEFGPGGYLPPKAAKRARKIVLREQMGFGWPLAAVGVSLVVLIAGGAFLLTMNRAPADPYVAFGPVAAVPVAGAATVTTPDGQTSALVLRTGGRLRAFAAEETRPRWCPESGRLETTHAAWTPDGRLVYGRQESLAPLHALVHDGTIYVDVSNVGDPLPPAPGGGPPLCRGG